MQPSLIVYETEAFSAALTALAKPIALKYQFPIVPKSVQPWREATTSVLAILEATLPQVQSTTLPRTTIQGIWQTVVLVANGIISATCEGTLSPEGILADEEFDIASFRKLRELIVPALESGGNRRQDEKEYAEGLFRTSIIHAPAPAEAAVIYGNSSGDGVGLTSCTNHGTDGPWTLCLRSGAK